MISIVVPAYNAPIHLMALLTSIHASRMAERDITSVEVVTVDDCSPGYDYTLLIPPVFGPVARMKTNVGFAGACNAGAKLSNMDILFFVNHDIVFTEHTKLFASIITNHFEDPANELTIWAPMLLTLDGRVQSAGGFFDAHRQPIHHALGWTNPDSPRLIKREVSWTTGAAFAIKKSTFEKLDGFSPDYKGGYFEDVDLCLRLRELGGSVIFDPSVRLSHVVGSTGGNPNFFANAALFKSRWGKSPLTKPETESAYASFWPML